MEMIDEKGYDKKIVPLIYNLIPIMGIIWFIIMSVMACVMDDISFIVKLIIVIFTILYIYSYLRRYDVFCLFNYEEFHYYEVDRNHKKIVRHIHAKWDDVKRITVSGGSRGHNTIFIRYKKSSELKDEIIDDSALHVFRKHFKKYSKRDDIMLTVLERYKKRKPFEKDWE
jgi:hypothetical protein